MPLEDLKYPIGKFKMPSKITTQDVQAYISSIALFPKHLQKVSLSLNDSQLDTPY
ncbi:MAG: metal-dependent hydrolase, partial [Flavobacteriales bacterium]|nr:metal-dependent hydrolase [Flavobacteriales bacterium]